MQIVEFMTSLLKKLEDFNNQHRGLIRILYSYFELLFLVIAIPITFKFSNFFLGFDLKFDLKEYIIFLLTVQISWFVKNRINSQAKLPRTQRYLYLLFNNSQIFFILTLVVILFKFLFKLESIPVAYILIYLPFTFFITFLARLSIYRFLKIYRASGYNLHYVLIVADGFSDQVIEKLMDRKECGFKILGIVTSSRLITKKYGDSITIIPENEDLTPILDTIVVDEIIYSKYIIDEVQVKNLIRLCDEVGIIFRLQSSVSPIDDINLHFTTLSDSKFLTLVDGPSNHFSLLLKTIADYYFSIIIMILLSPVFLLIAIVIKLDSEGPIFFKQERIGLHGRKFFLFKFRTMVLDAEKRLKDLKSINEADGPVFKIRHDPRITKVGRFLRKTGLDELPQLQNVIRGEMSLIGPRPPLESEVKQYERWQIRRLSVKPGITCSWQVAPKRNDVKFESWMKMDLNYIENWSLAKDAQLFFRTIIKMFSAEGR